MIVEKDFVNINIQIVLDYVLDLLQKHLQYDDDIYLEKIKLRKDILKLYLTLLPNITAIRYKESISNYILEDLATIWLEIDYLISKNKNCKYYNDLYDINLEFILKYTGLAKTLTSKTINKLSQHIYYNLYTLCSKKDVLLIYFQKNKILNIFLKYFSLLEIVVSFDKSYDISVTIFDNTTLFLKIRNIYDNIFKLSLSTNITTIFNELEDKIKNTIPLQLPDQFLDPLLYTPIHQPVVLPNSNIIIDRETIETQLQINQVDPFSRAKLTLEELNSYNEKTEIKDKIKCFQKELNIWKTNNNKILQYNDLKDIV